MLGHVARGIAKAATSAGGPQSSRGAFVSATRTYHEKVDFPRPEHVSSGRDVAVFY